MSLVALQLWAVLIVILWNAERMSHGHFSSSRLESMVKCRRIRRDEKLTAHIQRDTAWLKRMKRFKVENNTHTANDELNVKDG